MKFVDYFLVFATVNLFVVFLDVLFWHNIYLEVIELIITIVSLFICLYNINRLEKTLRRVQP